MPEWVRVAISLGLCFWLGLLIGLLCEMVDRAIARL